MKTGKLNIFLLAMILLVGAVFFLTSEKIFAEQHHGLINSDTRIVDLPDQALGSFAWRGRDFYMVSEDSFNEVLSKKDPLSAFQHAFSWMRAEAETGNKNAGVMAERLLQHMLSDYEPAERSDQGILWRYGFEYGALAPGWWSGMDAFFGPLVLYTAYQQYGKEEYRTAALKSIRLAMQDPSRGGVLWKNGNECWVSEYTWPNMTWEEEYQVLNGHLYGLQALYMMAALENDDELMAAYECARAGSVSSQDSFYTSDKAWSWYSLVPKDVNPTHYLLFEAAQYNALYMLTGDPIWTAGYRERSDIFRKAYKPEVSREPNGEYRILLSMLGAPHPYWPDTYPLQLTCKIGERTFSAYNRKQYWGHLPLSERFFVDLTMANVPDSCSVEIDTFPNEMFRIYETNDLQVTAAKNHVSLMTDIDVALNAVGLQDGHVVQIDHGTGSNEGRIIFKMDQALGIQDVVALVVESEADAYIGAFLLDDDGNVARREYNPIVTGKPNLILLSRYGFNGQDDLNDTIHQLVVRLYADEEKSKFNLDIMDAQILRGATELKDFLSKVGDVNFRIQ